MASHRKKTIFNHFLCLSPQKQTSLISHSRSQYCRAGPVKKRPVEWLMLQCNGLDDMFQRSPELFEPQDKKLGAVWHHLMGGGVRRSRS